MADQGYDDFVQIICTINRTKQDAKSMITKINSLIELKADILDDSGRLAGVKEYVDLHDDYTLAGLNSLYNTLVDIKNYIESKVLP